jgi:hypothetical protein
MMLSKLAALLAFGLLLLIAAYGCGSSEGKADGGGGDGGMADAGAPKIKVSGNAFAFALPGTPYGRIEGAEISVLEDSNFKTTSVADGYFEISGLPAGMEATFVLKKDGFPRAQTKTFTLPDKDLEKVTFQVPDLQLVDLLAASIGVSVDTKKCQMVTTITRVGKSIYDDGAHGEQDATVSIDPAVAPEKGPIYFNSSVMPDKTLNKSSDDGGVLFVNVDPGEYVLEAAKTGVKFEKLKLKCRANTLVNASPPYGLQALP